MADSYLAENQDEGTITELEITPLVAVALVMVIVFMVTAPLFVQPGLEIELPKATTSEDKERENTTITITQDGQWAVNETISPFEELPYLLSVKLEESRDKYVIIRADQETLHKYLIDAMSVSKNSGAKAISIAVEKKK